jgi:hypothetical protein
VQAAAAAGVAVTERGLAAALDKDDPLAPLRAEFAIPTLGSLLGPAAPSTDAPPSPVPYTDRQRDVSIHTDTLSHTHTRTQTKGQPAAGEALTRGARAAVLSRPCGRAVCVSVR